MKFNVARILTKILFIILSISFYASQASNPTAQPTVAPKKDKDLKLLTNPLKNPLRLFKTQGDEKIMVRVRYLGITTNRFSKNDELSKLNYKVLIMERDFFTVYKTDQNSQNTVLSSKNYLGSVKTNDVDLPCNGYQFICTLRELKREYKKKLKGVNFDTPKELESLENPDDLCVVLTIGSFSNIRNARYLCGDSKEETVFYQTYLSEKISFKIRESYHGHLMMVNQVKFIIYIY